MRVGVNRRPGLTSRRTSRKPSGGAAPPAAPAITSLSATSGERWFASQTLTITGTDFDGSTATASFGSTSGITGTGSSGSMTITIPASELWETGTKNVTVTVGAQTSSAATYTVNQPTGLLQDLRADRGITLNGSTVSAWASQDGSADTARNVSQATGSKQPAYNSSDSAYNNKPTLTFSQSSATILSGSQFSGAPYNQTTVLAVAGWTTTGSNTPTERNGTLLDVHTNDATKLWYISRTGSQNYATTTVSTAVNLTVALATRNVETPSVLIHYAGATGGIGTQATGKIYIRSTTTSASGNLSATYNGFFGTSIGGTPRTTNFANMKLAEFLIFNKELSATELTRITDYFSSRYGSGVMTP